MTTTTHLRTAALLRAVTLRPDDTDLRLVFADHLEESGDAERAEFVRVQCELEKLMPKGVCPKCKSYGGPCDTCEFGPIDSLQRRERELLAHHHEQFFDHWLESWRTKVAGTTVEYEDDAGSDFAVTFRRGFVEAVTLPLALWLQHGRALVKTCPLREVVTDRVPQDYHNNGDSHIFGWWREHGRSTRACDIPNEIWTIVAESADKVNGLWADFYSSAAALAALSAACLRLAREGA